MKDQQRATATAAREVARLRAELLEEQHSKAALQAEVANLGYRVEELTEKLGDQIETDRVLQQAYRATQQRLRTEQRQHRLTAAVLAQVTDRLAQLEPEQQAERATSAASSGSVTSV